MSELRVTRTGDGEPVVFLHGYPDTHLIWREVMQRLPNAIAFDWPGTGESAAWPGPVAPWDLADRLKTLLDRWGVASATVVGNDMGGQVALAFAARHPARTKNVVVMNSLVLGDAPTSREIGVLRRLGLNRLILRNLPRTVFGRCLRTFDAHLPSEVREDLWHCWHRPAVREYVADWCAACEAALPDMPALYRQIERPVHIVWGDREHHFPLAQAHRLKQAIRHATLHVVKGGGHWMMWTHPAEVAAQIKASSM